MAVDVGEVYSMSILVRDVDAARTPMNAAVVALTITLPDQSLLLPQIAMPPATPGAYVYDYIPMQPGRYVYHWQTTNPTLVLEGSFDAIPTGSAGLISLARAKKILAIQPGDDSDDDEIRGVIRAATRAAENERDEVIMRRVIVETKRVRRMSQRFLVNQRPVLSLTSVTGIDSGTVWLAPSQCDVDESGIVESVNMAPFWGRMRVEYVAGYAVVPDAYQEAVGYIVQHIWTNREGSNKKPRRGGQHPPDEVPSGMGYSIPARARDLLGHAGPLVG